MIPSHRSLSVRERKLMESIYTSFHEGVSLHDGHNKFNKLFAMSSLIGNTYRRNLANINLCGSQWPFLALVKCKEASGSFPVYKEKVHQKCITEESFGSTQGWVNDDRIFIFGWTTEQATIELIKKKKKRMLKMEEETQFITFFPIFGPMGFLSDPKGWDNHHQPFHSFFPFFI